MQSRGGPAAPTSLFAYPAQSNFGGVQHPLEWVAQARELGWDVLLGLRRLRPDQQARPAGRSVLTSPTLSFYKLFGYPTGIGALIARHSALAKLRRPWFAGGTVAFASVQAEDGYRLAPGATGFEDGTIDYWGCRR